MAFPTCLACLAERTLARMRNWKKLGLSVVGGLGALAVGCGGGSKPAPSRGGEEVLCPDGSANPGAKIRTVNCHTVVQFDGKDFEASINVERLASAGLKRAEKVLRDVSAAAEESQIQFSQTCELYNGCNLTSAEYRESLDKAQAHFRSLREKVALLEASQGNPEVLRATVQQLYEDAVPAQKAAAETLALELVVQARTPGQAPTVVRSGQALRTGDEMVFGVRTSQSAYVYIFQKKDDGKIDVLFPNPGLTSVNNPLSAAGLVRIPPNGQVFTLNDQDIGTETVYVAASMTPLSDLQAALENAAEPNEQQVATAMSNLFEEGAPECPEDTRALTLSSAQGCGSGTRGLNATQTTTHDDFFSQEATVQGLTAPGDEVVIQAFQFRHDR
jgi:hypothetical protein